MIGSFGTGVACRGPATLRMEVTVERTRRLHRLYAAAVVAIWIEAVLGLLWFARRRRDLARYARA